MNLTLASMTAIRTSAVLKSTRYDASGRKMVDEPKPAIVPTISEKNPITKNKMSAGSTPALHIAWWDKGLLFGKLKAP